MPFLAEGRAQPALDNKPTDPEAANGPVPVETQGANIGPVPPPAISAEFQFLIDQLVQLHATELSEVADPSRASAPKESWQPQPHLESRRGRTGNPMSMKFRKSRERREVNADAVLSAWENANANANANNNGHAGNPQSGSMLTDEMSAQMFDESMSVAGAIPEEMPRPRSWPTHPELQDFLQSSKFEVLITVLLGVHVLWMALELQVYGSLMGADIGVVSQSFFPREEWPAWEEIFRAGDTVFTALFTIDVIVRVTVLRSRFFKVCLNYVDVAVTCASLFEVSSRILLLPVNPMLFRLLRIFKLARALRMVTMTSILSALQLLIKCLMASIDMLFWTFCLLTFLQCVAGMVLSTLCRDFIEDTAYSQETRVEVYRYYGTFTRTFLTMFEILFANWSPPCRVLVDNVSEFFSIFFLLYRCVMCFAVLNVVNAVFVQQTMKTASSDEELAFKQKERDAASYTRKVQRLFQTMDETGDGALNFEEFSKLVASPKLTFWMSQLELDYHDLLSLFEFLDNGDGQITLTEFVEGASRLRGQAKALDVWRLETKVELLFEEILHRMMNEEDGSKVQAVFNQSMYKHITKAGRPSSNQQIQ